MSTASPEPDVAKTPKGRTRLMVLRIKGRIALAFSEKAKFRSRSSLGIHRIARKPGHSLSTRGGLR